MLDIRQLENAGDGVTVCGQFPNVAVISDVQAAIASTGQGYRSPQPSLFHTGVAAMTLGMTHTPITEDCHDPARTLLQVDIGAIALVQDTYIPLHTQ